ncbi:helix-turn-helix domain-containing protein [Thermoanaerobacterium sp. CMT5567-10]|jgi:excisionase family DNA binding protein|uniref:helix-turn-helix domain-containing protein n=1 Tax=Thermoanaerobacterium sp. CMT5567-10 TaxID=3061989 RepID=UPI0026E03143|nr:helix-turn-helix domain-containing protein [Thermoanaerobacterium sp. CMT5567-10]WKV08025.1 helix-turn-helix domain-containing protein [Thermoanaerobacterium sp. CMT5567-10]
MKKLLLAGDVAELLNINIDAVYRLTRENIIPYVRIGRLIRFDSDEIEEWIKKGGQAFDGGWRKVVK